MQSNKSDLFFLFRLSIYIKREYIHRSRVLLLGSCHLAPSYFDDGATSRQWSLDNPAHLKVIQVSSVAHFIQFKSKSHFFLIEIFLLN